MEFLAKYDKYCALVQEFLSDDHLTVDYSRFTNDFMFELKKVLYEFTGDEMYELFKSIKTLGFYTGAYKNFIMYFGLLCMLISKK